MPSLDENSNLKFWQRLPLRRWENADLTDDKTAACEARRWKKIAPDPELHRSAATDWTTDDQTELACSTSSEPISRADNDDDDDRVSAVVLR
jgi:hypothetical protein